MAALGCDASYHVVVADRAGATISVLNTVTEVEFTRVLNDASTCKIVTVPDVDCCEQLGDVRAFRAWVHVYRNSEYVWGGPVLTVDWRLGEVEINAADIVSVLNRRTPHQSRSFTGTDTTEVARWLVDDGFAPDDPGHTVEVLGGSGVTGTRSYTLDRGQTGDHLKDLADNGGLDFTAVGASLLLLPDGWDANVGLLTDADLPDGLAVSEDGTALATRWVVFGEDGSGAKGVAGGVDPYYGLIEQTIQDTSLKDQASAQAAAESRLAASLPAPVFIETQQITLSPDAGVEVPRLVPGWCVDLATTATCRNISQRFKITGLRVTADGDGESVQVQLGPVSLEEVASGGI